MGGTTSRFDETNWEVADGKLRSSQDTIDGAAPTDKYSVYYITKRRVLQREFDVTDADNNLLYSTHVVPGTIACFDVMGKGIKEHLLRVNVDIARRHWVVYRSGEPSFVGQISDKDATQKYALDATDIKNGLPSTVSGKNVELFRKCCITVSWCRYMAVVVRYKEPTMEQFLESPSLFDKDENIGEISDEDDDLFQEARKIAKKMRKRKPIQVNTPSNKALLDDSEGSDNSVDKIQANCTSENKKQTLKDVLMSVNASESAEANVSDTKSSISDLLPVIDSSTKIREWIQQQSKSLQTTSQGLQNYLSYSQNVADAPINPLVGVVDVNKPLLLCQEIYTRIIGNHQTSLLSKKKMLELMRQDVANKVNEESEEFDSSHQYLDNNNNKNKNNNNIEVDSPGSGVEEFKDSIEISGISPVCRVDDNKSNNDGKEPLVAYWAWENTLKTHKIKLHLAKGSDLALHVVLAVIANQVRIERNAIAMSL